MNIKRYKGFDNEGREYFVDFNSDYDIAQETDDNGNPLIFVCNVKYKGEIVSWKPFLAEYKSYNGEIIQKKFTCPSCGSKDCERLEHKKNSDNHFFQGGYKCSQCNETGFNYYSDSFKSFPKMNQQLVLQFDKNNI